MSEQTWKKPLSENAIITTRVRKTRPLTNIDFAVIGRICINNEWRDIIKIDNRPHQGKPGVHVHFIDKPKRKGKEQVEYLAEIENPTQAGMYIQNYLYKRYPSQL